MEPETILDLAQQVGRAACCRFGSGSWPVQDVEDACQEAALHIHQAMQRMPDAGRGYYARAGYLGAIEFFIGRCKAHDADRVYASAGLDAARKGWHEGQAWQEPMDNAQRAALVLLLTGLPNKRFRPEMGATVMQLLSRGLTQSEIGLEIGKSKWHVGVVRQRVRRVLEAAIAAS